MASQAKYKAYLCRRYALYHERYAIDKELLNVTEVIEDGVVRVISIRFSGGSRVGVKIRDINFTERYDINIDNQDIHAVELSMNNGKIIRCRFDQTAGGAGTLTANKFYERLLTLMNLPFNTN